MAKGIVFADFANKLELELDDSGKLIKAKRYSSHISACTKYRCTLCRMTAYMYHIDRFCNNKTSFYEIPILFYSFFIYKIMLHILTI